MFSIYEGVTASSDLASSTVFVPLFLDKSAAKIFVFLIAYSTLTVF